MKHPQCVICVDNSNYSVSLEKRKIYEVAPELNESKSDYIRVIDESGDDYIYPAECFVAAQLSNEVLAAVVTAA